MDLDLEVVAYDSDVAGGILAEVQAELTARYGGPDETPVDPLDFAPPRGLFAVVRRGGEVVGCAALRPHADGDVELKRMFVRPTHRRTGVARGLLTLLEDRARDSGYRRLVLETGLEQPEAIALYESAGYRLIPGFGYYADSPLSRSYAKDLLGAGRSAGAEPAVPTSGPGRERPLVD